MFVKDSTLNTIKTCSSTACIQPAGQMWFYEYELSSWKMQIQMYQANEVFVNDEILHNPTAHLIPTLLMICYFSKNKAN